MFFPSRLVEEEIRVLSHMADQINVIHLNAYPPVTKTEDSNCNFNNESFDLDNLFAFLSEVTNNPANPILDELSDKMDNLVQDLDVEVNQKV